jgi:hypothetical protein
MKVIISLAIILTCSQGFTQEREDNKFNCIIKQDRWYQPSNHGTMGNTTLEDCFAMAEKSFSSYKYFGRRTLNPVSGILTTRFYRTFPTRMSVVYRFEDGSTSKMSFLREKMPRELVSVEKIKVENGFKCWMIKDCKEVLTDDNTDLDLLD